ncbi:MAG: GPW/gp25 family protein [Bernardetiaceae bacterium]|nr:GPW/gp25 family protein [Bernardetiaceae bacterium]
MNNERSFLGKGWKFPPTFDKNRNTVMMVSDEQDINESLRILFSTLPGERLMNPEYGTVLHEMVFEDMSETLIGQISESLETLIIRHEPRIEVEQIDIDTEEYLDGVIHIELMYRVRLTNTRSNMVYPFYFIEGTNI